MMVVPVEHKWVIFAAVVSLKDALAPLSPAGSPHAPKSAALV